MSSVLKTLTGVLQASTYASVAVAISSSALRGLQWIADHRIQARRYGRLICVTSIALTLLLTFTESLPWLYMLTSIALSLWLRSTTKRPITQTVILPLACHVILTRHLASHNHTSPIELLTSGYHAITGHPLPPRSTGNKHLLPGGRLDWDLPDVHISSSTTDPHEYTLAQAMTLAFVGVWFQTVWTWAELFVEWSERFEEGNVSGDRHSWTRSLLPRAHHTRTRRDL